MKITKQQIKELDNGKTSVRELFPKVFEMEIGNWYWANKEAKQAKTYLLCNTGKGILFGFDWLGEWIEELTTDLIIGSKTEATEEEVFEALKKEAIKRGFKEGAKWIKPTINGKAEANGDFGLKYSFCSNALRSFQFDGKLVFCNGVWAEIIEPKENIIEIDGKKYKVTLVE